MQSCCVGWGDVEAYRPGVPYDISGSMAKTPTLNALAANGTLFTDFHTAQVGQEQEQSIGIDIGIELALAQLGQQHCFVSLSLLHF